MKQMMYVGIPCSGGTHNLILGKTEINPDATPSVLHKQLKMEGWKEMTVEKCLLEDCGAMTTVLLEDTILIGPVITTPEGVEL
jgi:hypothetical protein